MDLRFSGAAAFAMKLSKVALRLWVATSPHEKDSSHGAHSFKSHEAKERPERDQEADYRTLRSTVV